VKGLIIFLIVIGGIVYLFRYLRQREIDRFLDADMGDFQSFAIKNKQESEDTQLRAKAEAYAALNPNVETLKPVEDTEEEAPSYVPAPTLYELKAQTFDEVTRNVLIQLSKALPVDVNVLINVPLADFVTSDSPGSDYKLANNRVAFLLCDAKDLSVICGLQLHDMGTGSGGIDFIKSVFTDIGKPLIEFPLSNDISALEIKDKLDGLLAARDQQVCPKCGEAMSIRKANKGKNAGNIFWVCTQFPGCKGVIKA